MSADPVARGLANKARLDAAAVTRSANARRLIVAAREYGFWPQPLSRCPANDIPTLALGAASAVSAINGRAAGNPLVLLTNAKLKWLAGPTTQGGSGAWRARGAWYGAGRDSQYGSFEFVHTGTDLEIAYAASLFIGTTNNLRILVNDRIAAVHSIPSPTGSHYYLRLTFPVSATRRIRIEGAYGSYTGVNVANAADVVAPARTYPLIAVMGDSFPEATGASPAMDGEGAAMVRALGGNLALAAVGGTGLLAPGTAPKVAWTDATRLQDLTLSGVTDSLGYPTAPALGVLMMSINDSGALAALWNGETSYEAAIRKAVLTVIDAWILANPGKPLVVFGPTGTSGTAQLDTYRMRDAGMEACWSFASQNVWFIDRLAPSPVLRDGAKSSLTTTGTTTSGSAVVTALASSTGVVVQSDAISANFPDGTRVLTVDSATQVTLSNNATASGSGVAMTFKNDHAAHYTNLQVADPTHPDARGHKLDALWMAEQVRRIVLTQIS